MLRNPILVIFQGGGSGLPVPPLEFAHELSLFHGFAMKTHHFRSLRSRYKIVRLHRHKKTRFTFSASDVSNTVGFIVVSCADPGIFSRGESGGGGGGVRKTLLTFFRHQLFSVLKRGINGLFLTKLYFLRFQRGSNI